MENKNVEYNEIRCNKLILGDRKTGLVGLTVSKEEGFPALALSLTREDHKASVVIGFKDGAPTLGLIDKNGDKTGTIEIGFDERKSPMLTFHNKSAVDGDAKHIKLGFDDNGFPMLYLSPGNKEIGSVKLGADDVSSYLALIRRSINSGNIVLRSGDESAGIVVTSLDRLETEEEIFGILLFTNSEGSVLNIEGVEHINRTRTDKEEIESEE